MTMAGNDSTMAQTREHRVDIGAQVGIQRNLAFASGGRVMRLTPIAYRSWRPLYQVRGGSVLVELTRPSLLNR
jgi:hypothetical protein